MAIGGDRSAIFRENERAWRDYLARDEDADREDIITNRIMNARSWALI